MAENKDESSMENGIKRKITDIHTKEELIELINKNDDIISVVKKNVHKENLRIMNKFNATKIGIDMDYLNAYLVGDKWFNVCTIKDVESLDVYQ